MTTFVACNLPAGLVVEFAGTTVTLNGANNGLDPLDLPRNGHANDSTFRASGYGVTRLDDAAEAAFLGWVDEVTKDKAGKPLQHPFTPIATGAMFWAGSEADLRKEANKAEAKSLGGLDPAKDLPADVETSDETKAAAKSK